MNNTRSIATIITSIALSLLSASALAQVTPATPISTAPVTTAPTSTSNATPAATPAPQGIEVKVVVNAQRARLPIALPKPIGPPGTPATTLDTTMERDLDLSGLFKILPKSSYYFDTNKEPIDQVNFDNWKNVGAQGLIKSSITPAQGGYLLNLRLYNVDGKQRVNLAWMPKIVPENQIRKEVHEFINQVIGYYTGQKGILGSRIAYAQQTKGGKKQIFYMTSDGEQAVRVTKNNSLNILPRFIRGKIYYTSYQDDNPDLWVWTGGKSLKISSHPGQNSGASLCGDKLAVTLSKGQNTDIYLINPINGTIISRLTDNRGIDTTPTWNHNCTKIAYVSTASGSPQIYLMNADGSNNRRLSFRGSYNTSPNWSPTEDKIAFTGRDESGNFDIFTVDLNGNMERLTQNQGNNQDPSYSPDGRYIVFSSDRDGNRRLWLMMSDGSAQSLLTRSGSGYYTPSWER